MGLADMHCRYCRQTAWRLSLLAMLQDAGASVHPGPDKCSARSDGGDHDFTEPEGALIRPLGHGEG